MRFPKLVSVGWAFPMVLGVAVVGTAFAFAASRSLASDGSDERPAARCVSTPLETTDIIDRKTLYIEDRSGNAAVLTMSNGCLQRGEPVGFEFYGSGQICKPIDANITGSIASAVPLRCMVKEVKLLTREEAKAYRSR
ncbi:hypothetical protein ABI_32880 [Asticcacaulis biprosthecium C19]|uniref:Uncharacterized protein n=1 Tax=Asticcacaulis biprosthecium C19 TaxID=715226 RepID=F4QPY5_9CAUL|nr:hypothetical protein [Asticcacaulis biprosthecium]EGF90272.1 hypothetical protein ABI_32880 [Asticcacaulis biprosthecium C19]